MKTVELKKTGASGAYTLNPDTDKEIKITAAFGVSNYVQAPPGYSIEGETRRLLSNGQSLTLELNPLNKQWIVTNVNFTRNLQGTKTASFISDFATAVLNTVLTGLSLATSTPVVAADTILIAIGKLQAQITAMSGGWLVKVTSADTTPGYLNAKIAAGTGLDKTTLNPAANEQLELKLEDTAVTPGTYGDATTVPVIDVDQQGRITNVTDTPITFPADFIGSIADTNTVDLVVTGTQLTANVRHQDTSTVNLSDDGSGLKADVNEGNLDLANIGGQLDLATQVTGQLPEANLTTYNADANYYRKTGTVTFEDWYSAAVNSIANTTATKGRDTLVYHPFVVPKTITIDRIAAEVTGAGTAASVMRLGIYASSNCLPSTLVIDAGTISCASATFQSITINQQLTPGLYFFAYNHNSVANPTFRIYGVGSLAQVIGFPNTGGANCGQSYFVAETYGGGYTLPNPATTPTTISTAGPICMWVRLSA